ncbi:MAG TPA: polysaccharide pyruvyl transferase family protein, partial [Verrucomicrobiae bacterium]|nr:polysaccharide pyruvyl transferase family protein [Verrucomicrobiae bacterium]
MRLRPMDDAKTRETRGPRIGITGSYGGLNLGDEAILEAILRPLREDLGAECLVFSRDPKDTERRHRVEAVPVRTMTRDESRQRIGELDLLIFGGGGILYDEEAQLYLREANLALEQDVPVVAYGISAGPLLKQNNRDAVREALNRFAAITVRDRHAQRLLQDVGVEVPVTLTADPALLLEPAPFPEEAWQREGLSQATRLVALSVREPGPAAPDLDIDHYHALVANAADFVVERLDADVVFVPMERTRVDVQHSHSVVGKMQHAPRAAVLRGEYTSSELLALFSRFEFCIGMRLHFLIFAARQGVPFVSLPYASKVEGFIEEMELPAAPPLSGLNAGTLLAHIDRSWDFRHGLSERITANLPKLQARA